jgi:hypothetical protein
MDSNWFEVGTLTYGSFQRSESEFEKIRKLTFVGFLREALQASDRLPKNNVLQDPLPDYRVTVWRQYYERVFDESHFDDASIESPPLEVLEVHDRAKMSEVFKSFQIWMSHEPSWIVVGIKSDGGHYLIGRWNRRGTPLKSFREVVQSVKLVAENELMLSHDTPGLTLHEVWRRKWDEKSVENQMFFVLGIGFVFFFPIAAQFTILAKFLWWTAWGSFIFARNYSDTVRAWRAMRDKHNHWQQILHDCNDSLQ